jgi:hypothetical protein
MRIKSLAAILLLSLAGCQPNPASQQASSSAAAPTADDAKAFLTGIYNHYVDEKSQSDFDPAFKNQSDYFDPDMVALMKEDDRLKGENVGALDWDPFCGCQDTVNMTAVITIDSITATEAKATVITTAHVGMPEDQKPRTFTYDLRVVNGQWRIHDIGEPNMPSLRQLFINSNKELAAYNASHSATASSL